MSAPSRDPHGSMTPIAIVVRTLARSAAVMFALITLITVSCAGYVFFKVQQEKSIAAAKREFDQSGADLLVRMIAMEKKIRSDVGQTPQILTDASNARDAKHRDDGLSRLQALVGLFAADMHDAKTIGDDYGGPDLVGVFSEVEQRFGEHQARGLAMAKAYAAGDPSAIDPLRTPFDKAGGEIQESLKRTGPAIEVAKQARSAKTAVANKRIDVLREDMMTSALASCIVTALTCLAGMLIVRKWVVQPLSSLTRSFTALAAGDTSRRSVDVERADEIGDLGRAFEDFRRIVLDSREAGEKAREQDLLIETQRKRGEEQKAASEAQKISAMRNMVDRVEKETNAAVGRLIELMDHMAEIAADMTGAADRLGGTTNSVSSVAAQALASMRSASSSTRELTGSIERVAGQIVDAKATSDEAVSASKRASRSIEALSKVATEIDAVTGLIANITRQTGLLALNAGVEAARAGSEGHGFAIIAREIRSLADQTSDATNKIGGLIRQVQDSTLGAVGAVDSISKAIDRVSRSSESISNAIKAQVGTAKVIAESVDGTTHSVTDVTSQIQNVAGEAQGARTMARNVEDVCSEASEEVRALQMTLVKIVRTSSDAVNRRAHPRYEIGGEGTIEYGGNVTPVRVADISEGGARLFGEIDGSARNFSLNLPGVDTPLRARVARSADGVIHSKFEGTEEQQASLRSLLKRVDASGAPKLAEAS